MADGNPVQASPSASDLLRVLAEHRVRLSGSGDRLLVEAPPNALTEALKVSLAQHKSQLLALLQAEGGPESVDPTRPVDVTAFLQGEGIALVGEPAPAQFASFELDLAPGVGPADVARALAQLEAAHPLLGMQVLRRGDSVLLVPGSDASSRFKRVPRPIALSRRAARRHAHEWPVSLARDGLYVAVLMARTLHVPEGLFVKLSWFFLDRESVQEVRRFLADRLGPQRHEPPSVRPNRAALQWMERFQHPAAPAFQAFWQAQQARRSRSAPCFGDLRTGESFAWPSFRLVHELDAGNSAAILAHCDTVRRPVSTLFLTAFLLAATRAQPGPALAVSLRWLRRATGRERDALGAFGTDIFLCPDIWPDRSFEANWICVAAELRDAIVHSNVPGRTISPANVDPAAAYRPPAALGYLHGSPAEPPPLPEPRGNGNRYATLSTMAGQAPVPWVRLVLNCNAASVSEGFARTLLASVVNEAVGAVCRP